jgi:hypothetical protein
MAAAIRLSQQHSCSLDHLVGAGEQRGRHLEAERLRGSRGGPMMPANMTRPAVVFATVLGAFSGLTPLAAQEAATDVAYVEAVRGRVIAFARGTPILVDTLDIISDRTRFDLLANSELRLCHYGVRRFLTMRGPARVTVAADGITVEPVEISQETCAVVQASKFQGGFVARGVNFKK